MLWSSSGIREARKEIGSAQPRWSKKLGGLRYIGIRLGGSIAVHVFQLHFLVDYLPLGGQRRGFTPRASVSFSITHRVLSLCLHLPSLLSLPFIIYCDCDFNWLRLFTNSVYSFCSFSTH